MIISTGTCFLSLSLIIIKWAIFLLNLKKVFASDGTLRILSFR